MTFRTSAVIVYCVISLTITNHF